MVLVEFSITPIGKGESVSEYVAKVLDLVDKSGLPYRFNAMSTIVEGNWEEVFSLIRRCHQELEKTCPRIYTIIKVDHRRGYNNMLEYKVSSVEEKLGKKLGK